MRALDFRFTQATQPLTDAWQHLPIAPRHDTLLGISFRPLQAAAFGLEARTALESLLTYPYQLIRLGAYWNQIEPEPGAFYTDELDWQIDAAERAGKQIILCLGPLKTFGYPEFFVPAHQLRQPFPEHTLIEPPAYPALLRAAVDHLSRLIERYRRRECIVAWQLEHEAVDPLGMEHSWRLAAAFVAQEAQALRQADATRPLILNGYLPASWLVRLTQWWNTRDQGDSLAVAQQLADMVGIDYYPRNALLTLGDRTLYLDGSRRAGQQRRRRQMLARFAAESDGARGKRLLVTEGQAEPWETATTPPSPRGRAMTSCLPEHLITNYNAWLGETAAPTSLYAYLFWGAEYWLLRRQSGDPGYLQAFMRVLTET
jgi:hypothetical protein